MQPMNGRGTEHMRGLTYMLKTKISAHTNKIKHDSFKNMQSNGR